MKKSKVTIDDLAGMVQGGFEGVDKRFNLLTSEVNSRFDRIEGRLDAIEMELIDIKKKLATVIDRREFELLKERVENLEHRLTAALNKKK